MAAFDLDTSLDPCANKTTGYEPQTSYPAATCRPSWYTCSHGEWASRYGGPIILLSLFHIGLRPIKHN